MSGPEIPWEIYTVLADADMLHGDDGMPDVRNQAVGVGSSSSCC